MSNANPPSNARVSGARGHRGNALLRAAVLLGAMSAVPAIAHADTTQTPAGSLTWYGITVYGVIDIGVQYDSASAPLSDYFPVGTGALLQKNGSGSLTTVVGSMLGQSKIGAQGREEFGNGWVGVFKLETFFNPWSGNITDALKSLTLNNGLALNQQSVGVDSSIAGQAFNSAAFVGITNPQFGTLTFGRQNGLLADGVGKYDPLYASNSFSVIGYSGTAAGGGDTEDRRLDSSVKYDATFGQLHIGAQYQPKTNSNPGTTQEFVLGMNFPGGSVDAFYVQKNDAIAAGSLSAGQVTTLPCPYTPATPTTTCFVNGKVVAAGGGGNPLEKSLAGTISDNTTTGIMGKYTFATKYTAFLAYEQIEFKNPSTPVQPGQPTIGGYILAYVNNTAFPQTKRLAVSWAGLRYAATSQIDILSSYYRYDQNSYSVASPGCKSAAISAQCSGTLNAVSVVGVYHFTKRFDGYAGAMWSQVDGGLANGYLNTSNIDPSIGVRYTF